jgi:hypothetical protein
MEVLFEWLLLTQAALELSPEARATPPRDSRLVRWLFGDPRGRGGWSDR